MSSKLITYYLLLARSTIMSQSLLKLQYHFGDDHVRKWRDSWRNTHYSQIIAIFNN